ncbi:MULTISPECIES: hypothetical protein [unclassified Sphingomonas]|nr:MULTISPECIES: hypothetical protein [unclassified Sphingomonas]
MIIHVVGNPDINGLKRALDRIVLLMIEQEATEVRNLYLSAEIWSEDSQVLCIGEGGRPYPLYIEQNHGSEHWEATGHRKPQANKRSAVT